MVGGRERSERHRERSGLCTATVSNAMGAAGRPRSDSVRVYPTGGRGLCPLPMDITMIFVEDSSNSQKCYIFALIL